MASYGEVVQDIRKEFNTDKTKTYEWRKQQLEAMLKFCDEKREIMAECLHKDLRKSEMEASVFEVDFCRNEVINYINNLQTWMKPEKVKKGLMYMMDNAYIKREPFGVALIIGAWNYPIQLTLLPLAGAIAAGNCAVLKPSEISEHTAKMLEEELPKYLDNKCVKVINGGVSETTALLKERWDHIFYTGSSAVGKIVMTAAAKHLTPVILELGGKSPVFVDKNVDLGIVAKRILWGKTCNSGQICIAPDYVMCTKDTQANLIEKFKDALKEFYPEGPEKSDSYCRIVSDRHFGRLKKVMEDSSKQIAVGGEMNAADKFMGPTFLTNVGPADPVMTDEIFGPILPIMPVDGPDAAVEYIVNTGEKPLAMYIFTNNQKTVDSFVNRTSSGMLCVNDCLVQGGVDTLPFGGVGKSGMGSYHGKHTYEAYSHKRAVLQKNLKMESVNSLRYPPFTQKKLDTIGWVLKRSPKKSGVFSILPFFILGTLVAVLVKTFGLTKYLPSVFK